MADAFDYQAFILNHPDEVFDSLEGKFSVTKKMPANTMFFYDNEPTVILINSDEGADNLVPVKGIMQFDVKGLKRNTTKQKINKDWYALTLESVESIEQPIIENKQKLFEAVQAGTHWNDPLLMGPYTLGANFALPEVQRQLHKHRWGNIASQLQVGIYWLIGAMIIGLIMVALTRPGV